MEWRGFYSTGGGVECNLPEGCPSLVLWNILNISNFLNTLIFKIFHTKYFEYSDFQQVFNTVFFENQHFPPVLILNQTLGLRLGS